LQSTDISNALEKAVEHLDNSDSDRPIIIAKHEKPFALQMKDKPDVDENKYSHLVVTTVPQGVKITSALEQKPLTLTTEKGEEL
jgi:hypothetical protein